MKYALAITAAAVIAASAAFAGEKNAVAKDLDHKAMEAKMDAKMEAHFKEVDANADGSVTEQETFKLLVLITRCSNNYGPYQFPEKLIPLFITNALADQQVPLYGDGLNVRDWIHVADHCAAIDRVLHKGVPGEVYNIGGNCEKTNREITHTILDALGKPETLISKVKDRPGHDRRYAIDCTKLCRELGWSQQYDFQRGMKESIRWYLDNQPWLSRVKGGEYQDFYQRWYGER